PPKARRRAGYAGAMTIKERIAAITAWGRALKPVRVVEWFVQRRGPLLASGLSYQAIFAVFAAVWVTFVVAGGVIASRPALQTALLDIVNTSIPGLIDDGDGGAIDPAQLFEATVLGWTGVIAAGVLLFTALGWLASGRAAVRVMFDLPASPTNVFVLKFKDLGLAIGFGLALLVSAVVTVAATAFLGSIFELLGIRERSDTAQFAIRAAVLAIVLLLDTIVLATFYRVVSGIAIPLKLLAQGTVLASLGLGALKLLGTNLLGGASTNPLLASFAVIIGLLLWFNLVCQLIVIGAAWIAVGADDAEVELTGKGRTASRKRVARGK
ncbi:MAG: YihY/virulence factor BrkB family protein, partial [Rhodoglobus sp.]|nr:YihY/virulence factor BrkB family protein [Rhodoglobus sp.]